MPPVKNIAVVILAATGLLTMGALPVAAQRATTDNHIAYYLRLLQRNPQNSRAYFGLGDALIRRRGKPAIRAILVAPKRL